jgi:2-polyprenyl-6-methoxyphenol hydroxylase-like FAD-dependent oxidoreductase
MGGGATASPDPVLIAGAGPVGVTTALLLARFGVPAVVLEAEAGPDQVGSKAICMQRDVLDVLDRVGVAEAMVAEGTTWTVGRTYYRDRELFTTSFPDPGGVGPPPWINISQCSTEAHLLARAAASPLVALRWSHRVVGLSARPGGVEVQVAGPSGEETLWGSHLVGADGAHSSVRGWASRGGPSPTGS